VRKWLFLVSTVILSFKLCHSLKERKRMTIKWTQNVPTCLWNVPTVWRWQGNLSRRTTKKKWDNAGKDCLGNSGYWFLHRKPRCSTSTSNTVESEVKVTHSQKLSFILHFWLLPSRLNRLTPRDRAHVPPLCLWRGTALSHKGVNGWQVGRHSVLSF
jgi:hypothetical protein